MVQNDFLDIAPYPCDERPLAIVKMQRVEDSDLPSGFKKFDSGKARMGQLFLYAPLDAVLQIVQVMAFGAAKYGLNNWKLADGADLERYEDALGRHWAAWKSGEANDPESGLHHLAHMGCNVLFLIWHHVCKKEPSRGRK